MDEKVSIVVSTYNSESYIEQCMMSLKNQTYRNLEMVFVDDGSSDQTVKRCRELAEGDARIRIYPCTHRGVSATRNEGIGHCTGKYVTFVDSDDYVEPNLVERYIEAVHFFENNKKDVAFILCGMHFEVHVGTLEEDLKLVDSRDSFLTLPREKIGYLCWLKIFNFITNKLYDLETILQKDIQFSRDIQIGEDLRFNLDYLKAVSGELGVVNEPLYHYVRRTENSLSMVYYKNAISHTKEIYKELIGFAQDIENISNDDIMVLKAIYLADWTRRITALYDNHNGMFTVSEKHRITREEIRKDEYQQLLKEVHQGKKITTVRYLALRTKRFDLYFLLRRVYRLIRGKKGNGK